MKEIENIFSTTKTKKLPLPKCPNPSCRIIIDKREKQSLIASNLYEQKANLDFEILEVGDYLIGETIIERKTYSDFISSIIDKRLFDQTSNLKNQKSKFLILEGFDFNYHKFKIHENAIRGALISLAKNSIPIIYSKDEKDTATFLVLTAKKYEKNQDPSARPTKNLQTLEEQKQFILEGFPGIGPSAAKKLLQEFKSLDKIFTAKESELSKVLNDKQIKEFQKLIKN